MKRAVSVTLFAFFAMACGAFLATSNGAEESGKTEKGKTAVVQWEYRREQLNWRELNDLGEQGWEAFAVRPTTHNGYSKPQSEDVVYLKRQKR